MNKTRQELRQALRQGRAAWAAGAPEAAPAPQAPPVAAPPPRASVRRATGAALRVAKTRGPVPRPAGRRKAVRNLAHSAQEVLRPAFQRAATPPEAIPTWPRLFVGNPSASLEERLADLERGTRRAMGPVALRGIEWGVRLGLSLGGAASLALAFVPGALLPIPALGVIVVAASVATGLLVGAIAQAIARVHFDRRHPGFTDEVLTNLVALQAELLAQTPTTDAEHEAQVRQLRRIELLQHDVEGGLRHAGWQILFAVVNVDPRLRVLMRTHKRPPAAAAAAGASDASPAAEMPRSRAFRGGLRRRPAAGVGPTGAV